MTRHARLPVLTLLIAPLLAGAPAGAAPDPIAPPAGWTEDAAHAEATRRGFVTGLPDGVTPRTVDVRTYTTEGAALIVTAAQLPADEAAAARLVRQRVTDLRDTPTLLGDGVRVETWQEQADPDARTVEARLVWAHDADQLRSTSRAVWTRLADPDVLVEARADCLVAADASAEARGACERALAALVVPAPAARQPITLAAAPTGVTGAAEAEAEEDPAIRPADGGQKIPPGSELPGMRPTPEGLDLPISRGPPRQQGRDFRPVWVVIAIILVALALLWNHRKRKELLEAEEQERQPAPDRETNPPDQP